MDISAVPNFSHMSDIDLALMYKECSLFEEDKEFRRSILEELGRRQKSGKDSHVK